MDFSISNLRSTLQHTLLQSPDIIFWFEHDAFPLLASRSHPHDYLRHNWKRLKERRLTGVTSGFVAKSAALHNGFTPVSFNPPLFDSLHEIRVVRFIPNSGEVTVKSIHDPADDFSTVTLNCVMRSAVIAAKIGEEEVREREVFIEDLFDVQITLHSRKIEIM